MLVAGPWMTSPDLSVWPPAVRTPADDARVSAYAAALAFFHGDQWTSPPRRGETRLVFNYARALIRKTASYVFPGTLAVSALPLADTLPAREAANLAERLLTILASETGLARLDQQLAIDAAVMGDAALKVTWDHRRNRPRVAPVDPATLVAEWAPDDPQQVERIVHAYAATGLQARRLFPDLDLSALDPEGSVPVVEDWTDTTWSLRIAGQHLRTVPNPYGWIPYLVVANNPRPLAFWGQSDLTDLHDVCREINQRMTVLAKILELSGAPIAVLENVHGSEGISVGSGAKWELPEGAKAYLLDLLQGGGSQMHLDYLDRLFRMLHDLSETPRTAFGDSGRDLSGAALEVEIQPLVQKVERLRRMWDGVFTRRNAMLLDLLERFGGQPLHGVRQTTTIWPPILPSDREGAVRNAVSLVASGIQSRRSAIVALGGNDPESELAAIRAERDLSAPAVATIERTPA